MPTGSDYVYLDYRFCVFPLPRKNLITGEGHGHYRDFSRERPEKNRVKRARKMTKIAKMSRRKNRK